MKLPVISYKVSVMMESTQGDDADYEATYATLTNVDMELRHVLEQALLLELNKLSLIIPVTVEAKEIF